MQTQLSRNKTGPLSRAVLRPTCALALVAGLSPLLGCAFIPTPVRLLNKPHAVEKQADQGVRVCIIVRDERPQSIQASNMCGLMRNGYMIPTSFVFLSHLEHLDAITVHHLTDNFEHLGYTVVSSDPKAPKELSAAEMRAAQIDQNAKKAAWSTDRKTQDDPASKKKGLQGGADPLDEMLVSAWGANVDTSQADVVVEVKIRKFWCDCNYVGFFAWMSANLSICDPKDPDRKVVLGRKVRGFGYAYGLDFAVPYNVSVNFAYWFVLHEIEKTVASDDFRKAVLEIRKGRAGTP